jgi:lysophospholipase L1-like esterase
MMPSCSASFGFLRNGNRFDGWTEVRRGRMAKVAVIMIGTLPQAIMPDFLHLSPEGYQRWAEAIEPTLKELGI